MPAPDQMAAQQRQIPESLFGGLGGQMRGGGDLSHEIAALREEIADLRAALIPIPSLILTGRQVLDEFKRLHLGEPA